MTDVNEQPSAILSRVPWKLPVASKAQGIYIDLQDGRRLVDGVGMIFLYLVSMAIRISDLQAARLWFALEMAILL